MRLSLKGYAVLLLAAFWLIAIANWLGIEAFSPEQYEMWELPVLVSQIVVVVSAVAGIGCAILWLVNRLSTLRR